MKGKLILFFILLTNMLVMHKAQSCSMFKITKGGKTLVGNNEDFSNPNTRLWFERSTLQKIGVVYFGFDDLEPQGAMNEAGLVFDGFSVDPREQKKIAANKIKIELYPLKEVMQQCHNVDEVYALLSKYNLSIMTNYTLFYVDKSGNYLVVEADTLIKGSNATYAISNYCPSVTNDISKVDLPYFQKGRLLLESKADTSLAFCATVADSMHQSWINEIGGTLYSTIYDLNQGTVDLYFYHDYTKSIRINLKQQLQKPDTILNIPALFTNNLAGQKHLQLYNVAKKQINLLSDKTYAADTAKINALLSGNDVNKFLPIMEDDINTIGYNWLLKSKQNQMAINVLKINVKYCPWSSNAFDSLGEAYYSNKQYQLALNCYQTSVAKNPNNLNGKTKINELKKLLHK